MFAYHCFTNCLPCPYHFLTNCYMRSAELTALQHVHTKQPFNARASDPEIDMPVGRAISWCLFYARRELSKSRSGIKHFCMTSARDSPPRLAGVCIPLPYQLITMSLPTATCAELAATCEGRHFGVAGVGVPFPSQLLTMSLPFPFQLLHVQN